jgi:GNAT superfamily N-acetyltransferase
MALKLILADYNNATHAIDVVSLLNAYAEDPLGGGEPLPEFAKDNLVAALKAFPGAFSVLAYDGDTAVGLANCLPGFSTFACRPLINIHDLMVLPSARRKGASQSLLAFVEQEAIQRRCCKVTLEVLDGNLSARAAYSKYGFKDYTLGVEHGSARFMQKYLM